MKYFRLTFFISLTLIISSRKIYAGNDDYWQQNINYKIDVTLNDISHELNGFIKIEYSNNSPDTLNYIYFHLWPNAYKELNTAFAKQQLGNKSTRFYFSKREQRGYLDELVFKVNDQNIEWTLDEKDIDICKLMLNAPLFPGETITISTPFHVKIPDSFSRLGHVGQSYQITQWYPKPAVYDQQGWHPMPYLDQGEFYSEFGSFNVTITLPKNYVVGASGNLQNEEELAWLNELAAKTDTIENFKHDYSFPKSDSLTKTLHYKLENAHDFAWFADKRYHVLKGELELPNSGRKITTWAMFTNYDADLWKKSIEYIHDGAWYYSKWIGDYPYDNLTAVEGALSAGGGMEYPTITIIGATSNALELETVIVHEVGHNWFYGILGSNERDHPWMDEGINSFYETRYTETKYPEMGLLGDFKMSKLSKFLDLEKYKRRYANELFYLFTARRNLDQPIELTSEKYMYINYGTIVYAKSALAIDHLRSYLGDSKFDQIMQNYFSQWKFKHPQPEDFRSAFDTTTNKNLDWFFHDIVTTTDKLDYAIKKIKKNKQDRSRRYITIKNRSTIAAPFSLSALRFDTVVATKWYPGFEGEKTFEWINNNYHEFKLDADKRTNEINRKNDNYRLAGLMHKVEKLRFQLFGSLENTDRTQLFFTPVAGWNNYDKTVVGIAFYNHLLPSKKFEFELVPMFGTASLTFTGIGKMGYTFYARKSKVHNIKLSIAGKRFSYDLFPEVLNFNKIESALAIDFRKKNTRSSVAKKLTFRSCTVFQDFLEYDSDLNEKVKKSTNYTVNEALFELKDTRVINPYQLTASVQQGSNFIKTSAEFKYMLTYNKKNKGLHIRIFGGGFLWNNSESGSIPDTRFRLNYSTGKEQFQKDYLFDEFFFGRNETNGFFSQQVFVKEGGFRSRTDFGQTNKWISTINLNSTIPGKIPIRPYLSIGVFGQTNSKINMAVEAGISIVILPEIFDINFPLMTIVQVTKVNDERLTKKWWVGKNKNDSDNLYQGQKYWSLITFRFNLRKMNPFDYLREIPF